MSCSDNNTNTNNLFIKGEIPYYWWPSSLHNGPQQKQKKHKNKNHTDPTNYYTSKQINKIHYKNQKVLLILKCSCEEFSLIKLFCCIFLKFEWEIIFLYVPPRLFHRQHALEWKFLSPEFLLHDGVKLQI